MPAWIAPAIAAAGQIGASAFGGQNKQEWNLNAAQFDVNANRQMARDAWRRQGRRLQQLSRDASLAGIHPLAALGLSPSGGMASFGGSQGHYRQAGPPRGQNIGRAVMAAMSQFDRKARVLELERLGLENDLLRSEIAKNSSAQLGGPVQYEPARVTMSQGQPSAEAGEHPESAFFVTKDGRYMPYPSEKLAQSMEENPFAHVSYMLRNQVMPGPEPPEHLLPKGHRWKWSPLLGWKAVPVKKSRAASPREYQSRISSYGSHFNPYK